MRTKIYALGLACILLISCDNKVVSPSGPLDLPSIAPNIVTFTANPTTIKLGEKSTLSWEVHDCTSVEIDEGIGKVSPSGSIEVSPEETTTYTIQALNQVYDYENQAYVTYMGYGGSKTCTVTVE